MGTSKASPQRNTGNPKCGMLGHEERLYNPHCGKIKTPHQKQNFHNISLLKKSLYFIPFKFHVTLLPTNHKSALGCVTNCYKHVHLFTVWYHVYIMQIPCCGNNLPPEAMKHWWPILGTMWPHNTTMIYHPDVWWHCCLKTECHG